MLNTMKNHERRILLNTCYGHLMSHVNMLVFPAIVLPLTARLNMGMGEVLALSFWMYLLFGVTALPWGLVADRLGAKPLLFVFYGGAGVASFAAALYLDSPSVFMVALAALGLFSGIYHPAGLGLISKEIQRVSYAMGINGMFGNLGLAIAPFLTGIVNWIWGPQAAYLLLGGLNLSGILLLIGMPVSSSQGSGKTASTATNGFMGAFALLLLAMMLGGLIYRGATVILPAYFELRIPDLSQQAQRILGNGMTPNLLATMGTSLIFLIGMLGQYTGGRCAEQFDPRRCYLAFLGLTIPLAGCLAILWNWSLLGMAVFFFFFLLGMQPIENTLVAQFTPLRFRHSAFGTKFILTFGVGAAAVKIVAALESGLGIQSVFYFISIVGVIAVLFVLWLIFNTRRDKTLPDIGTGKLQEMET